MAQIDEKLEAAAHARIDNEAAEARISTKTVHMSAWAAQTMSMETLLIGYMAPLRHQSIPTLLRQICVLRVIHHSWNSMTG